jgi:glycogen debranching enzyme
MNASVDNQPVTPRAGKPVEVNALWYHALMLLHEWSQILMKQGYLNHTTQEYAERAKMCKESFNARFWYPQGNHLADVIDGPGGAEVSLRPNQLLAIALRYPVLEEARWATVLERVTQTLISPYGLRTLAPDDPEYRGDFGADSVSQVRALHQGSVWPWLVGPYVDTLLRVGQPNMGTQGTYRTVRPELFRENHWLKGLHTLEAFRHHLQSNLLGNIGAWYSGNEPHIGGSELGSALSVGEILRAYKALAHMGIQYRNQAMSV